MGIPELEESSQRSDGVYGLVGVARRRWELRGGNGEIWRSWEKRGWMPLLQERMGLWPEWW